MSDIVLPAFAVAFPVDPTPLGNPGPWREFPPGSRFVRPHPQGGLIAQVYRIPRDGTGPQVRFGPYWLATDLPPEAPAYRISIQHGRVVPNRRST